MHWDFSSRLLCSFCCNHQKLWFLVFALHCSCALVRTAKRVRDYQRSWSICQKHPFSASLRHYRCRHLSSFRPSSKTQIILVHTFIHVYGSFLLKELPQSFFLFFISMRLCFIKFNTVQVISLRQPENTKFDTNMHIWRTGVWPWCNMVERLTFKQLNYLHRRILISSDKS